MVSEQVGPRSTRRSRRNATRGGTARIGSDDALACVPRRLVRVETPAAGHRRKRQENDMTGPQNPGEYPGYGAAPEQPGPPHHGQPQYGEPQYGEPQYGEPQYGQPQY